MSLPAKARIWCLLARDENNLLRSASELQGLGANVTPLVCDVGDQREVQQAVAFILRQNPRIDILVNNAGIIQVGPAGAVWPSKITNRPCECISGGRSI